MAAATDRDELVTGLVRIGELEVSGENQVSRDTSRPIQVSATAARERIALCFRPF
jgi:hypothetical protein